MKLTLMKFTCASHLHEFLAPDLSPYMHGEFLLRSSENEIRFLKATENRVFDEVESLIVEILTKDFMTEVDYTTALHRIFGDVASDPDSAGHPFKMNVLPQCPYCGTHEMAEWDIAEPSEATDVPVEPVTHHHWNSLSTGEKFLAVQKAMDKWINVSRAT